MSDARSEKKNDRQRHKGRLHTSTTLPIHDNVTFIDKGGENDDEELVVLLKSPSPWHIAILQLILVMNEVREYAIHLELVSHV